MEEGLETYEMKNTYIKDLLETIRNLSDLDYQQKVWVEASLPNVVDCWEETMCAFFDDASIDYFLEHDTKSFQLNRIQIEELWKLRNELRVYSHQKYSECDPPESYSDPREIIKDPEWHKIVEQAKRTLEAFEGYEVPKD